MKRTLKFLWILFYRIAITAAIVGLIFLAFEYYQITLLIIIVVAFIGVIYPFVKRAWEDSK